MHTPGTGSWPTVFAVSIAALTGADEEEREEMYKAAEAWKRDHPKVVEDDEADDEK